MIFERAQELGRLLGQTEEYKTLMRANDHLKGDKEAGALLEELKRREEPLKNAMQQGAEPPTGDREAYEQVLHRIEALPQYQAFVAAQANFDKLMHKVNERILGGMRQGSSSPIITLS